MEQDALRPFRIQITLFRNQTERMLWITIREGSLVKKVVGIRILAAPAALLAIVSVYKKFKR